MLELPTKSELLLMPTLYTEINLAPIITKFFNPYLGHLNLKDSFLSLLDIQLKVVKYERSLTVSMPYSNSYDYYNVWSWGILTYLNQPNLLLINNEVNLGPLIYLLGDINITRTILYTLSQQMEVVQDGFAYNSFDSVLTYNNVVDDIQLLL